MKKLFLLVFLPLVLTGCSFTSAPTQNVAVSDNNNNTEVKTEPLPNPDSTETKECAVPYFKFQYPVNWLSCSFTEIGKTTFKIDERTNLDLSMTRIIEARYNELKASSTVTALSTASVGGFYEYAKEGTVLSGVLNLEGIYYDVVFTTTVNARKESALNVVKSAIGTLDALNDAPKATGTPAVK